MDRGFIKKEQSTMAFGMDALSAAFSHTGRVLFSPLRPGFYGKMAFLSFIAWSAATLSPLQGVHPNMWQDLIVNAEDYASQIPVILVAGFSIFFLMLFLVFFGSAARLLLFIGVRDGSVSVVDSFSSMIGRIVGFFLWNVIIPLIVFVGLMVFMVLVAFLLAFISMPTLESASAEEIPLGFLLVFIAVMSVVFILVLIYSFILNTFALPQVVFMNRGIVSAFFSSFGIMFKNLGETFLYAIIRFCAGLMLVVVMGGMALIINLVSNSLNLALQDNYLLSWLAQMVFMVPAMFMLHFVLLPATLFMDAFALHFMFRITGDGEYLNIESKKFVQDSDHYSPENPQSPPNIPPKPPTNEPVSFRDIPEE